MGIAQRVLAIWAKATAARTPSFVIGRRLQASNQLARINTESAGQLEDVVERDVAPTSLDLADKGPVETTGVGQCFLTLAQLMTASPDTFTEGGTAARRPTRAEQEKSRRRGWQEVPRYTLKRAVSVAASQRRASRSSSPAYRTPGSWSVSGSAPATRARSPATPSPCQRTPRLVVRCGSAAGSSPPI